MNVRDLPPRNAGSYDDSPWSLRQWATKWVKAIYSARIAKEETK